MFKIVDESNIDKEHICCSLSSKDTGVKLKKEWMKEQMKKGLVFNKLDVRGKVFIEYIPAEFAYAPITADDYLYIDCFWVSGKYKNQGYGKELLGALIADAKDKDKSGIVVLSSNKKKPFLSDPKFLKKNGFLLADTFLDYELLYLSFKESIIPKFNTSVGEIDGNKLYYSYQCPFTDKYVKLVKEAAESIQFPLEVICIDSLEKAKEAPCPFTTYSLYLNGELITNEILTAKKFLEMIKPLQWSG